MSEEGRRFFRYVLPGLVFFIETLLFAYIILPAQTLCFVDQHLTDLGSVVSAFLISGGLGYMFGAVHHFVHWYFSCEKEIFNHQKVIKQLLKLELLELKGKGLTRLGLKRQENGNVEYLPLCCCKNRDARMAAWTFSQSLWYHFLKSEQSGKDSSANPDKDAIDKLGQQAQGLGTARIASFFALLTTFYYVYLQQHGIGLECGDLARCGFTVILGVVAIWMFYSGYKRVAYIAHGAYTITLVNECSKAENKFYLKRYCDNWQKTLID